ncbi:MAG TPA: DUF3422 domain-containing protein [Myxococcota bacterium]|nr:DUF3422 domain-containing protein [Myxococcota bacterium]
MSQTQRDTRIELSNEWHARPGLSLPPPFHCTHVVELTNDEAAAEASRAEIVRLCRAVGRETPSPEARYHSIAIGPALLKWERHTEAVSHTILAPGNAEPLFSEPAIGLLGREAARERIDRMFVGVQIEVVTARPEDDPVGHEMARSLLGRDRVYGGLMSARTSAVWSTFELDAQGFVRLLVVVLEENEERLSRLVQRLLDLETYRMMAMLALPKAREVMSALGRLEPGLDEVMRGLAEERDTIDQERSLEQITGIAAKVEHILSSHAYRFAASRAYSRIVERRAAEVEEEIVADHQRYTVFLSRSLQPAMRTCDAAERRAQDLAERVGRAASMLDTMVDIVKKQQNQAILESMAESSRLQLKLQQAVEGFSIVAISYYGVGLLSYGLKSAKAAGLRIEPDLATGIAAPLVLAAVWLSIRKVRRQLEGRGPKAPGPGETPSG